jgi:hypothetical protein
MSKFHDLFPDLQELFTDAIKKIDSFGSIRIKIIANDSLKEISKVSKANDLTNYLTDEDVIIQVNEQVFEQLDEKQQAYVIDETLAKIYVDVESDKIKMIQPDFSGFSLVMLKYGIEESINTAQIIKTAFAQLKEQEAENGQAAQSDSNE